MRHAILVALTLTLGPVAADGFRAWPEPPPAAPVAQAKAVTLAEAGGLILGGAYPPHHLEPFGAGYAIHSGPGPCSRTAEWYGPGLGYAICPGDTAAVWTTALGSVPSK